MSVVVITAASAWEGGALDYALSLAAIAGAGSAWEGGALSYADSRAAGMRPLPDSLLTHDAMHTRGAAQALTLAPGTLSAQVQDRGGRAWRISLAWDGLDRERAAVLADFLAFAAVPGALFRLALDRWTPGWAPLPGERVYACTRVQPGWTGAGGVRYGARLEAVEVVGAVVADSDVVRPAGAGWRGGALDYAIPQQWGVLPGLSSWVGANDAAA